MTSALDLGLARRRRTAAALAAALFVGVLAAAGSPVFVPIVASGRTASDAADAVRSVGGRVISAVDLVDGVVAEVPAERVTELGRIVHVSADRALHVRSASFDAAPDTAFPYEVGATDAWHNSAGQGVGVALVDTGVVPVPDLLKRVAAVADLTSEQTPVDHFGHGTFMAGLIAGDGTSSQGRYTGVAPGANLISIKVAVSDGSTTLGTVLTGLQLVHNARKVFNIRVVLLAMSSPSDRSPERDPLTRGLRRLWDDGIFVVVPAGNDGPEAGTIDSPGFDPTLMTAGAVDDMGTPDVSDDAVVDWSSRGPTPWGAKPEVAAPGAHIVSLRAPGSTIDVENPNARVGDSYFRGSGTSMSAAITAGVAALVLSTEPELTPAALKQRLIEDATPLAGASATAVGAGVVHASVTGPAVVPSPGDGSLSPRNPTPNGHWSRDFWDGRIWDGRIWDGRIWDGRVWDGRVWDGRVWDGRVWDGRVWDGRVWDGRVWDGRLWAGRLWG